MFKKLLDEGRAGDNVGLLLRGIDKDDVERGQVVSKPGTITPHTLFKGEVYVLSKDEGGRHTPFFKGILHAVQGRSIRIEQGRGRAAYAVLQRLPAAVLLPDDGRDGSGAVAGGHRDGDARGQREPDGGADHAGGYG